MTAQRNQAAADRRSTEAEVMEIVGKFAPEHQRLVASIRRRIRKLLPAAHEIAYEYRAWFVISYSPTERGYEGIIAIRGDSSGVKLYFTNGKDLPDPDRLLKGSANARYIDVENLSILGRPAVARLIDEALARNRTPFATDSNGTVTIRATSTSKRPRPSIKIGAALIALLVGASGTSLAQSKENLPSGWKLVWSDEFNDKTLDVKKWNVLIREQSKHGELQYYLPDEVYLENGYLRIRSQRRDYGGQHYTSGRLSTDQRFAPTYGRFEIRGRMPFGKGLWPAYWLYPQNRDWAMEQLMSKAVEEKRESSIPEYRPWYSEIDIMEYLGHEPDVFYGTLHYTTFGGERKTSSGTLKTVDLSKDFHLYALEWEPNEIRWYVDGALVHSTVLGVPHTPHYLIINTAVGGSWPGNPDSTTTFPQFHDIDYVRIYQRQK